MACRIKIYNCQLEKTLSQYFFVSRLFLDETLCCVLLTMCIYPLFSCYKKCSTEHIPVSEKFAFRTSCPEVPKNVLNPPYSCVLFTKKHDNTSRTNLSRSFIHGLWPECSNHTIFLSGASRACIYSSANTVGALTSCRPRKK